MAKLAKKTPLKSAAKIVVRKAITKKTGSTLPASKKTTIKKPLSKKSVSIESLELPEQLLAAALKILDERQAEEIVTIPLKGRSSVADYLIIASGRAGRQVAALADYLREAFFKLGVRKVRIEGMGEANWVLVDAGDIVIHLFRPEVRRYYDLDAIWTSKPIK